MTNHPPHGYFADRWHARVPLRTLFWRDMWAVATLANLLAGFLSLMAVAQRWGDGWALGLHFALLPYNLFLVAAVWRWPHAPRTMRWTTLGWLGLTLVI